MVSDGPKESNSVWPIPNFCFEVQCDSTRIWFQEVSGLDFDAHPIEYRDAHGERFSTVRMPGIAQQGEVTLKKGVPKGDANLPDWLKQIHMIMSKRTAVRISLVDEAGLPTMVWTLKNAFPAKITSPDLKRDGSEVAIESMVLVHEGLTIERI